ncbi:MAG: phosphoadenosine phosphosulfate reductase family protein [Thermoplasmata archaeon]
MPAVRLGKMHLRWCKGCNVPILEQKRCSVCDSSTVSVDVTPPGDTRPAFESDIRLVRKIIDGQFGEGSGESLIPDDKIVLLNGVPHLDRMDEVILDGQVLGALQYNPGSRYKFIPRMEAARRLAPSLKRSWIIVDDGAVESIASGASVMVSGIVDLDSEIEAGDEVVALSRDKRAIAAGSARISGHEMKEKQRGAATKTRWASEHAEASPLSPGQDWQAVLDANKDVLDVRVDKAARFVRKVVEERGLPVAVSFSGGKDSLATLLLVLDAGLRPDILFVDTGLEFPETAEHVSEVADEYGLRLVSESAGESFWAGLETFGPPGKDFRWCCKTSKLGPAARLISKNYPEGVLSFIGQRRYESIPRSTKGPVWTNPWVPGQYAASPIQDWTALHVWLYIFSKGASSNPWYSRGLSRIGCFLCPASDLAELEIVSRELPQYGRWAEYLADYAKRNQKGEEWLVLGLWRWKMPPKGVRDLARSEVAKGAPLDPLKLQVSDTHIPCTLGVRTEGFFMGKLDMERVTNMLTILGEVDYDADVEAAQLERFVVFKEGLVIIRAESEDGLASQAKDLERVIKKAENCVACGVCLGLCENDAIIIKEQAWIVEENCERCKKCLYPCSAADFEGEFRF